MQSIEPIEKLFRFCLQILEQTQSKLSRDNFSFSAKAIVGTFLQPAPAPYATDGEYIRMSDTEVAKRLEELKMFTNTRYLDFASEFN